MHTGEYVGENLKSQKRKILILGESHHGGEDEKGKPAPYTSSDVVNDYLSAKKGGIKMSHRWFFFTKIAHMFDCTMGKAETIAFWENVSFGNYIDVSCGVKDGFARDYLRDSENTARLNADLFEFVNSHGIDTVLCVSPLAFSCLPMSGKAVRSEINHHVLLLTYKPDFRIETGIVLKKPLTVYCTPHPSGYGFKPEDYNMLLKSCIAR